MNKTEKVQVAKVDTTSGDYEFHVLDGTLGPSVIDISSLYGDTGQFTYDPGFTSTASCESKITYIDGEKEVDVHEVTVTGGRVGVVGLGAIITVE